MRDDDEAARHFGNDHYLLIKAATRKLIKFNGGLEAAATSTRVQRASLQRYGSVDNMEQFIPVDVVADLEAESGRFVVTKALARAAGFFLVPMPPASGDAKWVKHLGDLGKEAGEVISKLAEALTVGGDISAEEVKDLDLLREVAEAQDVLASIELALKNAPSADKMCGGG